MLASSTSRCSGLCNESDNLGSWTKPAAVKTAAKLKMVTCVPVHNQNSSGRKSTLSCHQVWVERTVCLRHTPDATDLHNEEDDEHDDAGH